MAVEGPILVAQRMSAAKIETTTGSAIALADADGAFNIMNPSMTPEIPMTDREGQGSASQLSPVAGPRSARFKFQTDLYNAASTPAWMSTLLVACGFQLDTGAYRPLTGSNVTLTMGYFEDGRVRKIAGAMGNFTITGEAGKKMAIDWEFLGLMVDDGDAALLAPTYPTAAPLRFAGATITYGSFTPRLSKLSITPGNQLVLREDAANDTGYHSAYITRRKPAITMDPEAVLVASQDWLTLLKAGTAAAFSCAVGSGSNKIITIAAPAATVVRREPGDREGYSVDAITLQPNRSASAGDDELTITPT